MMRPTTTMMMIATMMIGKPMVEDRQLSAGWTLGQLESLRSSHAATSPTLGIALQLSVQLLPLQSAICAAASV